jgi:hypothetical protein
VGDLSDDFFQLTGFVLILHILAVEDSFLYDGDIDYVQMIVVYVSAKLLGQRGVFLIGVHNGGQYVLLPANLFHGAAVRLRKKLFGKIVAAVLIKVGGIYVKDKLVKNLCVRLQPALGYRTFLKKTVESLMISFWRSVRSENMPEMYVEFRPRPVDVCIVIGFIFAFVMAFADGEPAAVIRLIADYGFSPPSDSRPF